MNERRSKAGPILLIVLGAIVAFFGLVGLGVGGTGIWADKTQRDADGYFATGAHPYLSGAYAITHEGIDINDVPEAISKLARVRIHAVSANAKDLFIGVAPSRKVVAYLGGVSHSELDNFDLDPFKTTYLQTVGTTKPKLPASQKFWTASATGASPSLKWDVHSGDWSFVLMNADGSRGVATDATFAARIKYLGWLWLGFLAVGLVLIAAAIALLIAGIRGLRGYAPASERATVVAPMATTRGTHPATLQARLDEPLSRWKWLVKWFLAIPHYIVLIVLGFLFVVLTIVAWFAILFTGRYPRGIFDFNLGVMRWAWRVHAYTFGALSTDRYPPFSMQREDDYPATLDVAYPEQLSRGLIFVKWFLAIPHLIIVGVLAGGGTYVVEQSNHWHANGGPWSGLIGLLALIAGFALLFTDRYPRGLFDLIMGFNRWVLRTVAYVALMTDQYPPFRLDQGGDEPSAREAMPVPTAS